MNKLERNVYCIIPEGKKIDIKLLDTYLYLLQNEDDFSLKVWYKDLSSDKTNVISVICSKENRNSCIEAIETLMCKEGLIGLDDSDAFRYMGGELGYSYFGEYSIRQEDDRLIVSDVDNAKFFCKEAKGVVVLIDGWYSLLEAQEILEQLELDDVEIAYQVHVGENKKNGKVYIWTSDL